MVGASKIKKPGESSKMATKPLVQILDEIESNIKAVAEAAQRAEEAAKAAKQAAESARRASAKAEETARVVREDILDSALIRLRRGEPSKPFREYLAEREKRA